MGTNFEINKDKITHSEPPNFDRNHDCMHAVASVICSVLFLFFNTIALILLGYYKWWDTLDIIHSEYCELWFPSWEH